MYKIVKTQTLKDLETDAQFYRGSCDEAYAQVLRDHYTIQRLEADLAVARLTSYNWRELYVRAKEE